MLKGIEVYSGEAKDARLIQEVFYKTWLTVYPNAEAGITEDDIHDFFSKKLTDRRIAELAQHLAYPDPHHMLLAAKAGDHVVGVVRAGGDDEYNRLFALYVLPEYQGRGIGHELWGAVQYLFDSRLPTQLGVTPYNTKAIAFYEKLGFKAMHTVVYNPLFRMKSGNIIPSIGMVRPRDLDE
jgi:ribosomal protein S18 acetylase RimI-like enzyme